MSKYIETLISDQECVYIEVSDEMVVPITQPDVVKASPLSLEEITNKARSSFHHALEITRALASEFVHTLRDLRDPPEEVEVSFGLKLDASADVLVAKAGMEAQFNVKLRWRPTKPG